MQDGGAHPGGDAAAHHRRHGMLPSQGYKATRMQGRSSQAAGLLGPWAKQAGAGRRREALLIHTHTLPNPSLNTGVLFLLLITRNRSVHAISGLCGWRQLLRLQWGTHTHTEEKRKKAAETQILQFLPFLFPVYMEHRRENATRQLQSI